MASLNVDREPLRRLALDFLTANLSYYRVRRELLNRLQRLCSRTYTTNVVAIQWADILAVRQVLMLRNEPMNSVFSYSAQVAGLELLSAAQTGESEGEEEADEEKVPPVPAEIPGMVPYGEPIEYSVLAPVGPGPTPASSPDAPPAASRQASAE